MFHSITRIFLLRSSYAAASTRAFNQNAAFARGEQKYDEQIDYLKSINDANAHEQDWTAVKNTVLTMQGNVNQKNADAVILKTLIGSKNFVAATLMAEYLKTQVKDISLGSTNSILRLYYFIGKDKKLSKEQKQFILQTYDNLYEKYKVLDSSTSEQLLHALCVINEWERALKVLNEIHQSAVPSLSAYSTIIGTFFKLNKKKKALELIQESTKYNRPLQDIAYEEWIKHILRKYKDKKVIYKHIEEIYKHIVSTSAIVSENTSKYLKETYISLNWDAQFSEIKKENGQCSNCKEKLERSSLSNEEFNELQKVVKDKLIVGSDLLLKSTHEELRRFLDLVNKSAPYDVVLDGLNISYTANTSNVEKLRFLDGVVDYFIKRNRKVLLLGRKHMLRWNQKFMERIMSKTCYFLTENLSQDDPYLITAAILSGPQTDIVSKDLLRGHKFNLKDENLKQMFKRWQWQHQWMVYSIKRQGPVMQAPLCFTPIAQRKKNTWHIPYESERLSLYVNDGTPDLSNWICLTHK